MTSIIGGTRVHSPYPFSRYGQRVHRNQLRRICIGIILNERIIMFTYLLSNAELLYLAISRNDGDLEPLFFSRCKKRFGQFRGDRSN